MIQFEKNFRNASPSEIISKYPETFRKDIYLCFRSLLIDVLGMYKYENPSQYLKKKYFLLYNTECSCFMQNYQNTIHHIYDDLGSELEKIHYLNTIMRKQILNDDFWNLCIKNECTEYKEFLKNGYRSNLHSYDAEIANQINDKEYIDDVFVNYMERKDVYSIPKYMLKLAIGKSCNLKCLSCRNEFITDDLYLDDFELASLIKFVNEYKVLVVGIMGEFFFKENYLQLFRNPVNVDKIVLFSNGTLFNEENWNKLYKTNQEKIKQITISIDAGTEETYKKVRSPLWKNLIKNLEFIKELQQDYKFELVTNFTISKYNVNDIIPFADKFTNIFDKITYNYALEYFNGNRYKGIIKPDKREEINNIINNLKIQYPGKINL